MSMLTFRNRQGALVDIPTVKATQVKNEFGSILEKAMRSGAVAITRHAAPKAVLLSYEEFESAGASTISHSRKPRRRIRRSVGSYADR